MEKRILIFGPIGDFGGRELESGFIASVLSSKFDVAICSSGTISEKSQFFDFNKGLNVFSVNQLLFDKYWIIRILAYLSFLKNKSKGIISSYSNNLIIKRFFNYEKKTQIVLDELISDYDLIFICAQLTSGLIDEVIKISKDKGKKVIFRTTGAITEIDFAFITEVDCFIHHSLNNAKKIDDYKPHRYEIIDQCAYQERDFLKIPLLYSGFNNFLIISRLSPEKGIKEIIVFFLKVCSEKDILLVAGNGVLEHELKIEFGHSKHIKFLGFVNNKTVSTLFKLADCLIIPSIEESGPLVGVEAMAAGKIIISTKTGAMPERLENSLNDFWFDINDFHSFEKVIYRYRSLKENMFKAIRKDLRSRYGKNYSNDSVSKKYLELIDKILMP